MVLVFIFGFLLIYLFIKSNLRIDFKSFFKKGFKKTDNKFGIICYTAKQGKGKTYSAVEFCYKNLQKNKNCYVLTNVKSFADNITNSIYRKQIEYCDNIFDIIDRAKKIKDCNEFADIVIFFDEIFTCLNKSGHLKREILSFLSQLRKRKILLITTAQEWSEINIGFRRYVRFQVVPNMFGLPFTNTAFIIKNVNDGDLIHWDNDLQDFVAPTIEKQLKKCNKDIIKLYDTFETISMTQIMSTIS